MKMASGDRSSLVTRQFLIRCLRTWLAAERAPALSGPIEGEVDWKSLLQLAEFHRVTPLLFRFLRRARPQPAPESLLMEMGAYVRSAARRSLALTGELLRLVEGLEAHGITPIPIKGPALAFFLYGDAALRQFGDLDILVRQQDLAAAKELLLSRGYQPEYQLTRRQEEAWHHNYHHLFSLRRRDGTIVVELHRDIMPSGSPFHGDLDGIWRRRKRLAVAGATVASLSTEDLLLFLCVHGSKHSWRRLQWLCDVAQLISCHTVDWGQVTAQANSSSGQQMLFLGLFLADDILGTPIPRELEQIIARNPQTKRFAGLVKSQLFEGSLFPSILPQCNVVYIQMQAGERMRDRVVFWPRFWLRTVTSPTPAEWNIMPLPDLLFPLYYVIRPVRLAGKYALKVADLLRAWFTRRWRSVIAR